MVSRLRQLLNRKLFVAEVASAHWGFGQNHELTPLWNAATRHGKKVRVLSHLLKHKEITGTKLFCGLLRCKAVTHECSAHCCHAWLHWTSYTLPPEANGNFYWKQNLEIKQTERKTAQINCKAVPIDVNWCQLLSIDVNWCQLMSIVKTTLTKYVDEMR